MQTRILLTGSNNRRGDLAKPGSLQYYSAFPQNAESRRVTEGRRCSVVSTEVLVSRNDLQPGRKTNKELHLPPCWHGRAWTGEEVNVTQFQGAEQHPGPKVPQPVSLSSQGRGITAAGTRQMMSGIELILTSLLPLLFLLRWVSSVFPLVPQQSWGAAHKPSALLVISRLLGIQPQSQMSLRCGWRRW